MSLKVWVVAKGDEKGFKSKDDFERHHFSR